MFNEKDLKQWLLKHDAEKRCIDGFWMNFENYKIEEPDEYKEYFADFKKSELIVKVESISISYLNYPELNYNHVRVYMPILYLRKRIGYYELLLNFNGIVEDDFFVLE